MKERWELKRIRGVIPAMLTPFDGREEVDIPAVKALAEHLVQMGVGGLYLTGSTGEGFLQNSEQRMKVVEAVTEQVNGRVGIIVHVGSISTKESILLARQAQSAGADAVSAVPPFYYKFGFEQIVQHYTDIADATDLPLVIYSIANTGVNMSISDVERLASVANIGGIKLTSADTYPIQRIKRHLGDSFTVYSGCDEVFLAGAVMGADGFIGSTYNLIPDLYIRLLDAVKAGELARAEEIANLANDTLEILLAHNYMPVLKDMMNHIGVKVGSNRRPFYPNSEQVTADCVAKLRELKAKHDFSGIRLFENL